MKLTPNTRINAIVCKVKDKVIAVGDLNTTFQAFVVDNLKRTSVDVSPLMEEELVYEKTVESDGHNLSWYSSRTTGNSVVVID